MLYLVTINGETITKKDNVYEYALFYDEGKLDWHIIQNDPLDYERYSYEEMPLHFKKKVDEIHQSVLNGWPLMAYNLRRLFN